MAFLPYWPRRATVSYNLLAYAALWSWASFVMGLVGGSTGKWADVYYYSPADGVNFSRGLWRECTWASFPGQSKCNHISPKHAFGWERAVQGLWIIWFLIQFVVAVLFTAAMPAALRIRDRTGQGERAINSIAKAAGALSLFNGFIGLVVMSVFVARTPDGGRGVAASNKSRHLHWSYGLFTAAWCLNVVMAPIGWAA